MSKNKCCGNCKHMENQDLDGFGWCDRTKTETHCALSCDFYESMSGWTEITPDNIDEVDCMSRERIVIGWIKDCKMDVMGLNTFWFTLKSMAMQGGFYYYVLPELKIHNEQAD